MAALTVEIMAGVWLVTAAMAMTSRKKLGETTTGGMEELPTCRPLR